MARLDAGPTDDQEVTISISARSGNILLWRLWGMQFSTGALYNDLIVFNDYYSRPLLKQQLVIATQIGLNSYKLKVY